MRKIPMRKCLISNERFPKNELVRIVKNNEGEVFVDKTGRANGRGAYINLTLENIKKAKDKSILDRSLETNIPQEIYEDLVKLYEEKNS